MLNCQKQNFDWKAWELHKRQRKLDVGQEIVRDKAEIQAYLARLMRILKGEELCEK